MKNLKINDEAHYRLKTYCDLNNLKMNEWVSDKLIGLIKNNTYVEITPRQSGKTTRLINKISDLMLNIQPPTFKPIAVITINKDLGKHIKDRLNHLGVETNDIIFSTTMYIPNKDSYQFFVDEFDFINRDKLFISDNGYYCTTLNNNEGDEFTKNLYQTYLNSSLWRK